VVVTGGEAGVSVGRRHGRARLALVVLLGLVAAADAAAQKHGRRWETVELALTVGLDAAGGRFQDFWDPGPALGATATFPFDWGFVEAGAQRAAHSARGAGQPDFDAWFLFAGWSAQLRLVPRVRWRNGVRAGVSTMQFGGDFPPDARSENELTAALVSSLHLSATDRWTVQLTASYQEVFTRIRVRQLLLGLGVAHRFGTPSWLRDFLD
jgi:hypothetical protein